MHKYYYCNFVSAVRFIVFVFFFHFLFSFFSVYMDKKAAKIQIYYYYYCPMNIENTRI